MAPWVCTFHGLAGARVRRLALDAGGAACYRRPDAHSCTCTAWIWHALPADGCHWLKALLELADREPESVPPALRALTLFFGGITAYMQADVGRSRALLEMSVAPWPTFDDQVGLAFALANLSDTRARQHEFELAESAVTESLEPVRGSGYVVAICHALNHVGHLARVWVGPNVTVLVTMAPRHDFAAMKERRTHAADLFEHGVIPAEVAGRVEQSRVVRSGRVQASISVGCAWLRGRCLGRSKVELVYGPHAKLLGRCQAAQKGCA